MFYVLYLFVTYFTYSSSYYPVTDLTKTMKNFRMDGVKAEIQSKHLLSKSHAKPPFRFALVPWVLQGGPCFAVT
jgi:hypothetical protein